MSPTLEAMLECEYFTSGLCNSCAWIDSAYTEQMALKIHATKELLHPVFRVTEPDALWMEPIRSPQWRFKNKAVMTVSGTHDVPVLGVLPEEDEAGVDITGCPQFPKDMEYVFAVIQNMVAAAEIDPYHAPSDTGELKAVEVTISAADELMITFIVRTGAALLPLRMYLPILQKPLSDKKLPAKVVSVRVDGGNEYPLSGKFLTMQVDDLPLKVPARSRFNTNTHVTKHLYRTAQTWADGIGASRIWDLHCGVGGLGLAMVRRNVEPFSPRTVWGIDTCEDSVRAANITAHELGYSDNVRFVPGNAARLDRYDAADLAVVAPPKSAGLEMVAERLNEGGPNHVLYSSSKPAQLADDLVKLDNYGPIAARLFDMYPNTPDAQTAVLLERR